MPAKKPAKRDCVGCRDNVYNGGLASECWSFESAKMVRAKDVPVDMPPPYKRLPLVSRPDCYKAKGYVRVTVEALTSDGYWAGWGRV